MRADKDENTMDLGICQHGKELSGECLVGVEQPIAGCEELGRDGSSVGLLTINDFSDPPEGCRK
jgi:hypothetical protein